MDSSNAATLGITVLAGSGDKGSSDGVNDGLAHVIFPASSPHITACGGTTLTISGGAIGSEVVWNDPGGTTGGGVSDFFPLPDYQLAAGVPVSANPAANTGRGVPDVASHADGFNTVFQGAPSVAGGTSFAAPLWAGLIALINQLKGFPQGFFNPVLYGRLGPSAALNDITSGSNGAYTAGPGWDACTGWGSPNGTAIASQIGPPTIVTLLPPTGPVAGGTQVAIVGTRLIGVISIKFGNALAKFDPSDPNNTDIQIVVTSPQVSSDGPVDVTVTTQAGTSAMTSADQFTYVFPIPLIQNINPPTGSVAGGDSISINGLGFTGATSVLFDQVPVTPSSVTDTQINVITLHGFSAGTVDLKVVTPGGTSAPSTFTFVVPPPVVTGINPNNGPAGTVVTVNGTGFTGVLAVGFDATGSSKVVPDPNNPDTQLTAESPIGPTGTVDVTVTTPGGTSATTQADRFTYVPVPVVTGINPNSGPAAGGTTVTVMGSGFTGVTAVAFGQTASIKVVPDPINPDTQLTADSPLGSGTVDVTVTTNGGTSATSAVDQFSYF